MIMSLQELIGVHAPETDQTNLSLLCADGESLIFNWLSSLKRYGDACTSVIDPFFNLTKNW